MKNGAPSGSGERPSEKLRERWRSASTPRSWAHDLPPSWRAHAAIVLDESPAALVRSHLTVAPRPPCEVDPAIPAQGSAVVMTLLAKRVEDRYAAGLPGGGPICPGVIHMKAGRQEDH
jgi:hypothetical protein